MRAAIALPAAFEADENVAAPVRFANDDRHQEVMVGGLKTACLSRGQLASLMVRDCLAARDSLYPTPKLVFASNGHAIAMAATDAKFRALFDEADIVHADGQIAVAASRLLAGTPIPERSATTDFIHDAAEAALEHGLRIFLLGATEEVNAAAAEKLRQQYPGLQIVGRRHGYFTQMDEDDICDEINLTKPDILFVGLSVPFEYEFAVRNRDRLTAGWLVTCGGCYNFVTGAYKRAPEWMQAAGLEWLHRLWREPRRLFWRYAVTNPIALALLATRSHSLEPTRDKAAKAWFPRLSLR